MSKPKMTMLAMSFMLKQFAEQSLSLEHATALKQEVQGLINEIEPDNTTATRLLKGFLHRFQEQLEHQIKRAELEQKHEQILQEINARMDVVYSKQETKTPVPYTATGETRK